MGRAFVYRFADYCRDNKIKGYFYQGGAEAKTIYGSSADLEDGDRTRNFKYEDVDKSDLAFVDTSKFDWYTHYLPLLDSAFQNETLRGTIDVFLNDGDHRTFYQIDCAEIGTALMTSVLSSHAKLLDSAIGLCMQSLTLNDWNKYLENWYTRLQVFTGSTALTSIHVTPPDTLDDAWSEAPERPTALLYENAIEVVIHKMVTGAKLEAQPFHIDSHHSCYNDDPTKQCLNYGAVTMLLPGSTKPGDQVSTHISTKARDWERNGAGIWLPTNVVHRGRQPVDDCDRHIYLIEVHSNGNFVAKDGGQGHKCKDVKAFTMTLAQLLKIKKRQMAGNTVGETHTGVACFVPTNYNPYLLAQTRSPYFACL